MSKMNPQEGIDSGHTTGDRPTTISPMKKLICIFVIFLVGCEPKPVVLSSDTVPWPPLATAEKAASLSINTLQFNEDCPHLCWIGINPGVTTYQEAKTILSTSNQIDQKWLDISPSEINAAIWHLDSTNTYNGNAAITFENGVVKNIILGNSHIRIMDLINLLGEPDKISYKVLDTPDGPGKILFYAVYFSSHKVMIYSGGGWGGPDSNDPIKGLVLNTEINTSILPWYTPIQPWLGYGHIKEYLPDVDIPMEYRTEEP
jgi:hypothetical protein